ncbi:TetR family transcriptional regulator [Henriciella barbarensis]|uniref:TetR family transcriptional regulator n=1 Tax=Henriciella barbarensis TaxID=86342 RepID=A0A399QVF7_9PROT|nr:TetR family transcriptional regulator [Henriciella barbarensis]RIJ22244.1 TetR family transcriptional regulator [Henriciella barbarensis]
MMTADTDTVQTLPAREKILQATLDLIPDWGADRITHRLVSAEADVSPGTITYHFDTIDALLSDAFRLYMADYKAGLDEALGAKPLQSSHDIVQFLMMLIATSPERADLARIEYAMIAYAQRDELLLQEVTAWAELLPARLFGALRRLGDPHSDLSASRLVRYCRGIEFDVLSRGISVDLVEVEGELLSLLDI